MKNMLNFKNFSAEELQKILDLALDMKKNPEKYSHALEGKKLYTLFEKTSTRTFLAEPTTTSSGRTATLFLASRFLRSNMYAAMWTSSWHVS